MASIAISSAEGSIVCGWQSDNLNCEGGKCCKIYGTCGTGQNCELAYFFILIIREGMPFPD